MNSPDALAQLLREQDQARARVCGAAQNALWFFEAQSFEEAHRILKSALDQYNDVARRILEFHQRSNSTKDSSRPAA